MTDSIWIWPALLLAFLLGWMGARWISGRQHSHTDLSVNKDYFKGLNFLLNEEPDKAIEVFIQALEVDSETVELHLALGGLFRRKGQVDRATRIHQNLIARASLTADQRAQAVLELANDYYKAGWLDRAEDLFKELLTSQAYRKQAITGLCQIYQQEKEWQLAIDVLRKHKKRERFETSTQVAHFYCELAEIDIAEKDFYSARQNLSMASSEAPTVARTTLLRGRLNFAEGNTLKARALWQSVLASNPNLADLVIAPIIESFRREGDLSGLKKFVLSLSQIPKSEDAFTTWYEALKDSLDSQSARAHLVEMAKQNGFSHALADHFYALTANDELAEQELKTLLQSSLEATKSTKNEYTCSGCGFETKAMYWFCPNCGEWESFI